MGTKEWLDNVEAKCGAVVTAYAELFDQIGTVDAIPGVTEDEIEEISAVVSVKLMRRMPRSKRSSVRNRKLSSQ